jgi:hypothetical protein
MPNFLKSKAHCKETVDHSKIRFAEEKSSFVIENPKRRKIEKYEVDGCIYTIESFKRCDFLAVDIISKREIYIELKGQDADEEAIAQIKETVERLSKNGESIKYGYIIHTSSQNPETDTTNQRIVKRLKQSPYKIIIRFRKTPHSELIDDLIK